MNIQVFLKDIEGIYKTGAATEHSYRADLQKLLSSIAPDVIALNEPKRVKCGAPDFIVSQGDIVIGHVEAKDIPVGIRALKDSNKDQQKRYLAALPNLIYTNCLDWDFYRDGELVASVSIADFLMGIQPRPQDFATLENLLREFVTQRPQTITSPRDLAERMAGKANLIKDVLGKTLRDDAELQSELSAQYHAFKENLIHDITPADFADIYAETIAYGMFAARLHDTTLDTFSRQEALELLPKSNPFLRSLFSYVAGYDLDDRIAWIIDDLARVFQACDVAKLMEGFGKLTGQKDPFLHFYETFLAAYNPSKRKARGVWYTPEPVVNFIVRAVDEVLQTEFGLPDGLADTSKVTIDWDTGQKAMTKSGKLRKDGKNATEKREVHRVQILDPATGTGTFLAEVIKQIAPKVQGIAPAMWSKYIEDDLIPRLHGFELLMASYAMCHMKLDMILTELGYSPTKEPPRLSVYLTNSLEEGEPANQTLPFTQWLSREAKGANTIKRDMPIMCVIGNPPYSKSSSNNGEWIMGQMARYKKGLSERKVNLNDDYMKFIRLAESLIEKNGGGVIAMITNNSFLDGVTQRKMRLHLRETFDKITILNLHGDTRSDTPTASHDENVFDIMQGVSIAVMRTHKRIDRSKLATVQYRDITGRRKAKYDVLSDLQVHDADFQELDCQEPLHRFLPNDKAQRENYENGFATSDFFGKLSSGIQTKQDALCIAKQKETLTKRLNDFRDLDESDLRTKYSIPKDSRDWKMSLAMKDVRSGDGAVVPFLYKPFDVQNIYYSGTTKGFIAYPRRDIMQHVVGRENLCLLVNRQNVRDYFSYAGVTKIACCHGTFYLGNRGQDYCLPLYLYPDEQDLDKTRRVNFDQKLYKKLQKMADHPDHGKPEEVQVFDYIYGVLHCPAYRETYAEFLKIDFPRIPWPTTPDEFWDVSAKGTELRKLHLMEPASIGATPYPFTGEGDNEVGKPRFEDGRIWINDSQYFADVPPVSWDFYIGGYQPAQKWLKDRKGRALSFADVQHYQRILKILSETDRIMQTLTMDFTATE
jgi:predicted helicase